MKESDKNRFLYFLTGKETVNEFESWIYSDADLETRIGSDLYYHLIETDYRKKDIIHSIIMSLLGKYLEPNDFKLIKYYKILLDAGWKSGRAMEVNLSNSIDTPQGKNAFQIIAEFVGLELVSPYKADYWTPRNIKFHEFLDKSTNMIEYGINKDLVCFASIDDDNSALYVDDNNNFYMLDNIASIDLYEFREMDFIKMMLTVLGIEEQNNSQLVGRKNRKIKTC